jgi:hypothetical protein
VIPLDAHAPARAIPLLATRQLPVNVVVGEFQPGRESLDNGR